MAEETPSWLEGMLHKRSLDALMIITSLVRIGLHNGRVSANDLTASLTAQVCHANVIGGCFRVLGKFGFDRSGEFVKSKGKIKHGRYVQIWTLKRPQEARRYIASLESHIRSRMDVGRPTQQLELL